MSIAIDLSKISSTTQLESLLTFCSSQEYHKILKNININLITTDLIKNLIKRGVIDVIPSDKFYRAFQRGLKFGPKGENYGKAFEYLQDQIRIHIQDKYLELLTKEIQEMRGRGTWADTITKVMMETAGCYELEMEKEISALYFESLEEEEKEEKEEEFYVVTNYGCNSGAHDMWVPRSTIFTDYSQAKEHYLSIRPSLTDTNNIAEEYTYDNGNIIGTVQVGGYLDGEGNCAKRPEGVVLQKCKLKKTGK